MKKISWYFVFLIILFACHRNSKLQNPERAEQLFSEGMEILDSRIAVQNRDKEKAIELNNKANEKFAASYEKDTTFYKPVLFASECTMYARDYRSCLYWTLKLAKLDTSQNNQIWIAERIKECKSQIDSKQNN